MRTRSINYLQYGFSGNESKDLKKYIRSQDFCEDRLLRWCCEVTNPELSAYLYKSLVDGLSYDLLSKKEYIPIGVNDFYGWQRLALAIFRNARKRGDFEIADKKIQRRITAGFY